MRFRATLNFRKCKVALNPMYRNFLNLSKVASHPAYQIIKKFHRADFEIKALKAEIKDVRAQNFPHTDFVKTLTAGRE